eukprot:m.41382 g.41382  ORF g.41382 m.41382 type:complete len:1201 (+) comp5665_c0_seq3:81-3683(+)
MAGRAASSHGDWVVHVNDAEQNAPFKYKRNNIRTTKYTILSFLPKNLFEQFHRVANCYFVFIVILNWIPQITAFGKEVAMIPIIFVLAVTAIKDAFEDRRRARSDSRINNSKCRALRYSHPVPLSERSMHGTYQETLWKNIQVGDVIELRKDEVIPADLLILHTSTPEGVCFVETANLDGETNLKQRRLFCERTESFQPHKYREPVICERPNNRIYEFNAHITYDGRLYPLDSGNVLLRGCIVRNTESVIGVVIYAGHDTKAMLNNSGPRSKRSKLEREMNRQIIYCALILLFLCLVCALGDGIWLSRRPYQDLIYLPWTDVDPPALDGFIRFFTWIIVMQALVPISLYISIELVKLAQVYFIQEDLDLYHEETDTKMRCRALNIQEDLGQIEYIFSDKTGTLTQNKMVFHKCSIGGACYPHSVPDHDRRGQDAFTFPRDPLLLEALDADRAEIGLAEDSMMHLFFLTMAACNTVVPSVQQDIAIETTVAPGTEGWHEESGTWTHGRSKRRTKKAPTNPAAIGNVKFQAESPDEAALVSAAQVYGYTLLQRTADWLGVHVKGELFRYRVLALLPFDNNRKRSSVILRCPDGNILMLSKGADSSIYSILRHTSENDIRHSTQEHLDLFARSGLRTLSYGYRLLSEAEFEEWEAQHKTASTALADRAEQLSQSFARIERELLLLGATGIEDKLQDGVPETIASLREANIKIWVLTGDKQETAIEIAHTCKLLTPQMNVAILNSAAASRPFNKNQAAEKAAHDRDAEADVNTLLAGLKERVPAGSKQDNLAMVIDGPTLAYALRPPNRALFLELSCACRVVVCCRSTPLQKAQVVQLVKEGKKVMTLAVGDGANDVSMIQMADVGVGISGQEGMQAVMASDFAIAQFRFLNKLLLVHGHWSYDRIARMILYFYYKNIIHVLALFWFAFFSGFSGSYPMDQIWLATYNLLFCSVPPIITAIFDKDASAKLLLLNPVLYDQGQKGLSYKNQFMYEVFDGVYQSLAIFFVPFLAYRNEGTESDLLSMGFAMFTALVLTVNIQVGVLTRHWIWINYVGIVFSIGLFVILAAIYGAVCCNFLGITPSAYWVMQHCFGTSIFWAVICLTPAVAIGPRVVCLLWRTWFYPSASEYAREASVIKKRQAMHRTCPSKLWSDTKSIVFPYTTALGAKSKKRKRTLSGAVIIGESVQPQAAETELDVDAIMTPV